MKCSAQVFNRCNFEPVVPAAGPTALQLQSSGLRVCPIASRDVYHQILKRTERQFPNEGKLAHKVNLLCAEGLLARSAGEQGSAMSLPASYRRHVSGNAHRQWFRLAARDFCWSRGFFLLVGIQSPLLLHGPFRFALHSNSSFL